MSTPKKTLVWRGGLVALTGGLEEARAREANPEADAKEDAESRSSESPLIEEVRAANVKHADVKAAARTVIMTSAALDLPSPALAHPPASAPASAPIAATRIMPIESLFPAVSKPEQAQSSDADMQQAPIAVTPAWKDKLRRLVQEARPLVAQHGRRGALYGGFALVLGGLALWPDPQPDQATNPAVAAPVVTDSAQPALQGAERAQAPATSEAAPLATGKGLERAAVDALASGDLERAQRLYVQLAEALPRPSPFSEAARILARRAQAADR